MNWHYLEGSEQKGPVNDAEFEALVRAGTVRHDTLVWHEGMAEWLPYAHLIAPPTAAPLRMAGPVSAPPGQVLCAECGQAFPPEEVIRHGNLFICANCKPVFLQKLKEGVTAQGTMNYAGFWIRCGAYLLDALLMQVVVLPMSFLIRAAVGAPLDPTVPNVTAALISTPLSLIFVVSYYTFFGGKYGATPGKMAAKLRIVNPDGSPISYGKACGRYFGYLVSSLACMIGFLMVCWDPEKRALHDRICSTRVIRK